VIVLGIETATQICAVALARDGQLLCEYRSNLKNAHAQIIAGSIEKILQDSQLTAQQLDGIAVSIGPGSFTGLRIGLATAKGIAFAVNCPIAAVPTLEALAQQAPVEEGLICPLIRSRASEVYAALYQRRHGQILLMKDVTVLSITDLPSFTSQDALLIGALPRPNPEHPLPQGFRWAREEFAILSGLSIARMGTDRLRHGQIEDVVLLEPRYLQDFTAGKPKLAVWEKDHHAG